METSNDICDILSTLTSEEFSFIDCVFGLEKLSQLKLREFKCVYSQLDGDGKDALASFLENLPNKEKCVESEEIPIATPVEDKSNHGYIYLLRIKKFVKSGANIYTIGKIPPGSLKAFYGHTKKAELICKIRSLDVDKDEKELIKIFKENYQHISKHGDKYFAGHPADMWSDIEEYLREQNGQHFEDKEERPLDDDITNFVSYVRTHRPSWYIDRHFIPKLLLTQKFNAKYNRALSPRTFMRALQWLGLKDKIITVEKEGETYQGFIPIKLL